jgi:hypothetical protein
MRPRLVALGCTVAGALGLLALPSAAHAAALPKPPMSVSTPAGSYVYGARVTLTVTLKAKLAGGTVSLYATPVGGARTLLVKGKVNSAGKFYRVYSIAKTTTFTAVFAGSADNAPATASRTVSAAARVADAITGYYTTTVISGVSYRVFHSTGTLALHSTVTPNKHGECLEPETEQYDTGTGWDADTKYGCDSLNPTSHDTAPYTLKQALGDRYRIRGDYIRGAKDNANLSADGPWLYFEVVK